MIGIQPADISGCRWSIGLRSIAVSIYHRATGTSGGNSRRNRDPGWCVVTCYCSSHPSFLPGSTVLLLYYESPYIRSTPFQNHGLGSSHCGMPRSKQYEEMIFECMLFIYVPVLLV